MKNLHISLIFIFIFALFQSCVESSGTVDDNNSANNNNHDIIIDDDDTGDSTDINNNNANNNNNNNNNWTPPQNSLIYVNTKNSLYFIDPSVSMDLVEIADFTGECTTGSGFYDIALDENRELLGIAAEGLYSINKETAACNLLFSFSETDPHFLSLSFVKGADPDNPNKDVLIGASAEDGEWVEIDPNAELGNVFVHLGYYDYPDYKWVSSGDIVSIQTGPSTYKTYATLKCAQEYEGDPTCESDYLAEINPQNGSAHLIGPTGFTKIFGLGFWGNQVFGFTGNGEYITIDITNANAQLREEHTDLQFWGAGTTTKPYVVQ